MNGAKFSTAVEVVSFNLQCSAQFCHNFLTYFVIGAA